MNSATATTLDAALEHASHGVPIFPIWHAEGARCGCRSHDCESPAKHPIASTAPQGFKNATTDADIIRQWWSRFPRANLAEATGHYSVVLDVDPDKGGRGMLKDLEAQHGALPCTPKVLTGGGGEHYRFRPVPGLRCSAGVIGAGLDIRAEDGYALLPPSNHVSGGTYLDDLMAPMHETPLAEMPPWLVALASASKNGVGGNVHVSPDEWSARLQGAPVGQRRVVALQIAGHYLGLRIAPEEVTSILAGYASRCTPPFPESEARALVRDLARRDRARASAPPASAPSVPAGPHQTGPAPPAPPAEAVALTMPDSAIIGLGRAVADLYARYLESPRSFFYMSFLTYVGAVISRKVTLDSALRPEPRLFTVLLGASADTRKTTSLRTVDALFQEAGCAPNTLHGTGSAEGIAEELKENPGLHQNL